MRKLILFLLVFASAKVSAQVYQEMPQYGYRANRMAFDSTLQIPTTCGVPTLKSIVKTNKSGAIAYDSCNAKFYAYNPKTLTWSEVSGGGGGATDTTSLSNRINQRIDSIRRSNDSIFARKNGVFVFQYKDSIGSPNLQQVLNKGEIAYNKNLTLIDSTNGFANRTTIEFDLQRQGADNYMTISDNISYRIAKYSNQYARISSTSTNGGIDKSLSLGWNGQDNFMSLGFANQNFGGMHKLNSGSNFGNEIITTIPPTSGTLAMSVNNNTANVFGNITLSVVDSLRRSTDSVFARKNGVFVFQYKDSVGVGGGSDTSKVVIAQVYNATATTLLKGEVVYLFGSTGNVASVKRANNKQDATSSKTLGIVRRDIPSGQNGFITTQGQIEKLNLGSYVEGDVLWLDSIDGQITKVKPQAPYHGVFLGVVERANNGNGLAYIKPQNGVELDEVHDVQINSILNNQIIAYSDTQKVWKNRSIYSIVDTTNTIATKSNVALKLNLSDTASLSNRINLKLNIADTTNMLLKYLRKTDTASLSNRIDNKQTDLDLLQSLSYGAKAEPYGVTLSTVTSQLALTTLRLNLYPFNWNVSDSVRGIAFFNRAPTTLTQTNYNGVAIYSLSGGTLTRLTFTANNGTFWDNTINTWKTNAITPYYLPKGVYYLGYQVSGSAGTPTIASGQIMATGLLEPPSALNLNGVKISSFILNNTTTPPSSIAMSTLTTQQLVPYFILY